MQRRKLLNYVDTAVIDRRNMLLPGEVFTTTSWLSKEVSRGHSRKSIVMMPSGSIEGEKKTEKKPKPSEQSRGSFPTLETTAEGLNIRLVKTYQNHSFSDEASKPAEN